MKAYRTSTDYAQLRKLLDDGCSIIIVGKNEAINWAIKCRKSYYFPSTTIPVKVSDEEFSHLCALEKVTFIEPNK